MTEPLSLEVLMDLAEKELDAVETGERFADTTTWLAVMSFVERAQKIGTPLPCRMSELPLSVQSQNTMLSNNPLGEPSPICRERYSYTDRALYA